MSKFIDNLPSLSGDQQKRKRSTITNEKVVDNFTVKKCPLMENFESMDPSTLWKPLNGSPIKLNIGSKPVISLLTVESSNGIVESMYVLPDSSNNLINTSGSNTLPNIYGITPSTDAVIEDDSNQPSLFKPDLLTKVYVGSLSLVGLFVLYRVVKKTI